MRFYSTRGEHVNHYTTDAVAMLVNKNYTESLLIKRKEKKKKNKKKPFETFQSSGLVVIAW
jgi:hypothetical protein